MNNIKKDRIRLRQVFFAFLFIFLFIITSCDQAFYLLDEVGIIENGSVAAPQMLSLSPASASVMLGNTRIFTASGGNPPYTFSIKNPVGGSNISGSGLYTASAGLTGTEDVRVTDSGGTYIDAVVTLVAVGNVDYDSVTVVNEGETQTSGVINGYFHFTNNGSADGTALVSWEVYVSSDGTIGAGDDLIATGTTPGLNISQVSASVPFTGVWPDQATTYNLIVKVSSSDEFISAGNTGKISVVVGEPNVDYHSSTVPSVGGSYVTGSGFTKSFTIENIGIDNGSADLFWSAYLSLDDTLDTAVDSIFDSGSLTGGLNSLAASIIDVSGSWPSLAGSYHLILSFSAVDDINAGNDTAASTAVFTITDPPVPLSISPSSVSILTGGGLTFTATGGTPPYIYEIQSGSGTVNTSTGFYSAPDAADNDEVRVTDNLGSTAVAAVAINAVASNVDYGAVTVNNTGATLGRGPIAGNFTFTNGGTANGIQAVSWEVYVSTDGLIGAGDDLIASNTTAALNSSQVSGPISFTGIWPDTGADYNLIVKVSASDDTVTANNSGFRTVTVSDPDVDYSVNSVTAANTPAVGGSSINESFYIQNNGVSYGTQTIFWTAYTSEDNLLDGSDVLIDSGQTPAMPAAGSVGPLSINSGSWPSVSGTTPYYLIVSLSSSDEAAVNTGNNHTVSSAFSITKPDIDYIVTSVSNNNSPVNVGTAVNETFNYKNNGGNNGTASVLWTAYASTDHEVDELDQILSSGSVPALAAGNTSGSIAINGNWLSTGGSYYLLVNLNSSDETNVTNNSSSSGLFEVRTLTAEPDYVVESITKNFPVVTRGSTISESVVIRNASSTGGTEPVKCDFFLSEDLSFGSDTWIGDVSIPGGIGAGDVSANISPGIRWPDHVDWPHTGKCYLFVQVSAVDENIETSNNIKYAGPFSLFDPPDYAITNAQFPVVQMGGNTDELISTAGGGSHSFKIENKGDTGMMAINWTLYQSSDSTLDDESDTPLLQDSVAPLGGGMSTDPIVVENTLPSAIGRYYYIIQISSGDDSNSANNILVLGPVPVWNTVNNETDVHEDDSILGSGDDYFIRLNSGDSVTINGLMDENGFWDEFRLETGPGITTLTFKATWTTGRNSLDMGLYYDSVTPVAESKKPSFDSEPVSLPFVVNGLLEKSVYYISPLFNTVVSDQGKPYVLSITAP